MLALVQRVAQARVEVDKRVTGEIGRGLLVFVCVEPDDTESIADKFVAKLLKLRIFSDDAGKMNRSVVDVNGGLLIVSQFTLAADVSGGNRPSFTGAAPHALGRALYEELSLLQLRSTRSSPAASSALTCRCISSTTDR